MLMPESIWRLLHGRGFRSSHDIEKLYSPSLKDLSHPLSIDQMDTAVDRLFKCLVDAEGIGLYGDYDLDGGPGLAILWRGLLDLGFTKVTWRQPLRLAHGYGLHNHLIKELFDEGAKVLLTVDVGITDVLAVDYANSLGMNVIITDHHLPKEILPNAIAIVNPNKSDCGSNLGHLAGSGVAFYLLLALKQKLEAEGRSTTGFNPKKVLDLFALATVTDMVPLIRENRVLVKHGLRALQTTENPGLRELMVELDLYGRELTAQDIGFKLAPKLNALSRLEEGVRPLDIFLADEVSARPLVQAALAINDKRRRYQKKTEDLANRLAAEFDAELPFLFLTSEDFHPGVVSVVANRLMETFGKPVFLGAVREGGQIVGSARCPWPSLNLQDVFKNVTEGLEKFGGHAMAAGFETHLAHKEKFLESLTAAFQKLGVTLNANFAGVEQFYDVEVRPTELNDSFMKWHDGLEPFGQGFESPVYFMKGLKIKAIKALKNGHFKFTLIDPESYRQFEAPWFGAPDTGLDVGGDVCIVFEPQWNHWNGRKTLQLLLSDLWTP